MIFLPNVIKQTSSSTIWNVCCSPTQKIQPAGGREADEQLHTHSLQTEKAGSTAAVFSNLSVTQETALLWTAHWECTWSCCRRDFKNGFLVFLKNKPDLIPEATEQPPLINIIRKRILSLLRKGSISHIQAPTSEQRGKEENGSS